MSTSPFKTYKEFLEAQGPIYTFANSPAVIGFFIVLSILISLYFIYATFTVRSKKSKAKNPALLGLLVMVGITSVTHQLSTYVQRDRQQPSRKEIISRRSPHKTAQLYWLRGLGIDSTVRSRAAKKYAPHASKRSPYKRASGLDGIFKSIWKA